MHARVISGDIQPGKIDEMSVFFQETVMPAAAQQQGFRGGYLLVDPRTGKALSVTLWESEADMTASQTSGYLQENLMKAAAYFTGPPTLSTYEVRVEAKG